MDKERGVKSSYLRPPWLWARLCPLCRSPTKLVSFPMGHQRGDWHVVECRNLGCWLHGPIAPTREKAIALWNQLSRPKKKTPALKKRRVLR